MNTVPLVEIDGLHAGYGDSRVLHGVSFAVPAGSANDTPCSTRLSP